MFTCADAAGDAGVVQRACVHGADRGAAERPALRLPAPGAGGGAPGRHPGYHAAPPVPGRGSLPGDSAALQPARARALPLRRPAHPVGGSSGHHDGGVFLVSQRRLQVTHVFF